MQVLLLSQNQATASIDVPKLRQRCLILEKFENAGQCFQCCVQFCFDGPLPLFIGLVSESESECPLSPSYSNRYPDSLGLLKTTREILEAKAHATYSRK